MTNIQALLTSFEGRIPRSRFWLGVLMLIALGILLSIILSFFFGTSMMSLDTMMNAEGDPQAMMEEVAAASRASGWVSLISFLVLLYPAAALFIKRRHDRGKSGMDFWIYAALTVVLLLLQATGLGTTTMEVGGMAVPTPSMITSILGVIVAIFGIYLLVVAGFLKGDSGDNGYGPDPLANR